MKTLRFFTLVLVAVIAFSAWPASLAYASSNQATDFAAVKTVKLTVDNRTGGTMYVKLSGPASYYFVASKQGKSVFTDITPGKYTIVLTTSACPGSVTFVKNLKGNANVKPIACRSRR